MPEGEIFPISKESLAWLKNLDERWAHAINVIEPISRHVRTGVFPGLLHAICGQQISGAAHASIWNRFHAAFSPLDYAAIANTSPEKLRQCGLSASRAQCMINLAVLFANGKLNEGEIATADDRTVRSLLGNIRGIGTWTIDMLLIFTLKRENVLPLKDLGIQRGMRMLYSTARLEDITLPDFSPYGTIAAFYLWEIASGKYACWRDPAKAAEKK